MAKPRTLYDKIWDDHLVHQGEDGTGLLYIDRHLVHEVTSPQAFEGLRQSGRKVRHPEKTLAVVDHNVPTTDRSRGIEEPESRQQIETLARNAAEFGILYFSELDQRQGIVHAIGPEQGFTLPGTTIVCGDSHTSTHGAFGALAHGIGTSEVEHVLATQTLIQSKARNMKVEVTGRLRRGRTAKDIILAIIGEIGTAGGTGHVIEYCGEAIEALSMEGRMTVCNMSIEGGARAGLIRPDDKAFAFLAGRPLAPRGQHWDRAVAHWRRGSFPTKGRNSIASSARCGRAAADRLLGHEPGGRDLGRGIGPRSRPDRRRGASRQSKKRALDYMGLKAGTRIVDIAIDKVFIGSCTNGRIEDLRAAAAIVRGRKVHAGVSAMVVPASGLVKAQAEAEGSTGSSRRRGSSGGSPAARCASE